MNQDLFTAVDTFQIVGIVGYEKKHHVLENFSSSRSILQSRFGVIGWNFLENLKFILDAVFLLNFTGNSRKLVLQLEDVLVKIWEESVAVEVCHDVGQIDAVAVWISQGFLEGPGAAQYPDGLDVITQRRERGELDSTGQVSAEEVRASRH